MAKMNALSVLAIGGLLVYYLGRKPMDSSSTPKTGGGYDSNLGSGLIMTLDGHWYDPATGWLYYDEFGTNPFIKIDKGGVRTIDGYIEAPGANGNNGGGWSLTDEERESKYLTPPGNQTEDTTIKNPDTTSTIVLGPNANSVGRDRSVNNNKKRAIVSADVKITGDPVTDEQTIYDEWDPYRAPAFNQTKMQQVSKRPGEAIGLAYTWTAGTTSWDGTPINWDYRHEIVMGFRDNTGFFQEVTRKIKNFTGVSGPQPSASYSFVTPGESTGTKMDFTVYVYGKESTEAGQPGAKYSLLTQGSKTDAVGIIGSWGLPGSSLGTIEVAQSPNRWRFGPTAYEPRI